MQMLLCLTLCSSLLISVTNGLNCIVCSSATNVNCDDPFRGDTSTSSSLSQGGFTSCLKTAYWAGWQTYSGSIVVREGSQASCNSPSSVGNVAILYCCSDKDNCNSATTHSIVITAVIITSISSLLAKDLLLY